MKKVLLKIDGMTCSACSTGLEKYLNKQDGIKQATVNLIMNNANIEYDDRKLNLEQVEKFVEKAGFLSLGIDNFEKEEKKKTNEKYKPELKSLILKYKTWKNVCKIFNLKSTVEFTNDEEKIIEKSLQNIELIEKIIGQFPSISDAKDYDINVDLLLKKYGSWEILRKWIENNK